MIKVCEHEFFEFNTYIQTLKIIHETSPPYSRASTGVVERGNKNLIALTNAILIESSAHSNL